MLQLWNDASTGVEVVRLTAWHEKEELIRVFEAIAAEEGWQPGNALRCWQDRSVYFGLRIHGTLAGGLQLVVPGLDGTLPCQSVWPEVRVSDPQRAAHIAIMAVTPQYRGEGKLFWKLGIEMWRHCVGMGIARLYIEVTPRVLPLYHRLGWPLKIAGEARVHWGEPCYLCTLGIPEVAEAILRRAEHSPFYQQIVGQAFRVSIPDSSFRRAEAVRECDVLAYAVG